MSTCDQTLHCFLERTLPQLKKCLADDDSLSPLDILTHDSFLPFRTSSLLFEIPLNERKKWVDLSMKVDPCSPHFKRSLACLHEAFSTSSVGENWKRCIQYLSALCLKAGEFWIELDIGSSMCEPSPNLFISTQELQGESFVHFATELFSDLYHSRPSYKLKSNLDRYAQAVIKREDKIFSFAIMTARVGKAVRVHSSFNISSARFILEERLREIGYVYDVHALASLLKNFPLHMLKKLGLALDIGEEISPTIGIERFATEPQSTQEEWEPFLEILVKEGLVSSETAQKCLLWAGGSRKFEGEEHYSLFIRRINHIKLTLKPTGKLSAKIYLRIVHSNLFLKK